MYRGKAQGFGQLFSPPNPSLYLKGLTPFCDDYVRSPVSLSLIRDDVRKFRPTGTRPDDIAMNLAISRATKAFMLPTPVPMMHLNDVFLQDLPIWSSSPGIPWSQQGYKTKNDIRRDPEAVRRVRLFWHRIKQKAPHQFPDCCAYVRAQIVKQGETKARAVWGYPATITFGEAVFALPLIAAYRNGQYPIAYGLETGKGGARRMLDEAKGNHFLGVDFSGFDKSVPEWLIRVAFDILLCNIDFTAYKDYGVARAASMLHMFDRIVDYFINTKIRLCNGERYAKKGGIASGSYFTQLIGSIVNYILITYVAIKCEAEIKYIKVLSDDSVTGTDVPLYPDDVARHLEPLGFKVNVEKTGFSRSISNITFLGYKVNAGVPYRPRAKVFAGLVYPERTDRDWNDVATRALGILYANLGVDDEVDFWCRRIVKSVPFDLMFNRNQLRYITMLGLDQPNKTDPPDIMYFARRLRLC